jgi:hypothetical protein
MGVRPRAGCCGVKYPLGGISPERGIPPKGYFITAIFERECARGGC